MNLRPSTLNEVVGNHNIKKCLRIAINASKQRNGVIPHILFTGGPGTGKTTLARTIANERNVDIIVGNGGQITSAKILFPYIFKLKQNDIFFIDEIHRVSPIIQETLYTAMEDFFVDLGKGGMRFDLPKFTLIGATTESGNILRPMYDRFQYKFELGLYNSTDLGIIVEKSAKKLGLRLTKEAVTGIIKRGRGTPRIVNSHLLWLRDYSSGNVSGADVEEAMKLMNIDQQGLTRNDRRYISVLRRYKIAVGLNTLVAAVGLSKNVIENDIEPYLIRLGIVLKTSRGRILC